MVVDFCHEGLSVAEVVPARGKQDSGRRSLNSHLEDCGAGVVILVLVRRVCHKHCDSSDKDQVLYPLLVELDLAVIVFEMVLLVAVQALRRSNRSWYQGGISEIVLSFGNILVVALAGEAY